MKHLLRFCAAVALCCVLAVMPELALAQPFPGPQSVPRGVIDYGQAIVWLQPYIITLFASLITALSTWVLWLVKTKLGINIDKDQAEVWLRAAKNQGSSLIADGFVKIRENGKVEVSNAALAAAANDLLKAMPDAAKHFNITLDDAAKKIVDMIPQIPAAPVMVAGAPVAKVVP